MSGKERLVGGLRERQKSDRSSRILEIARERFQHEGYESVTIDSIADEAGLSAVTVYNYYGSKAGLLLALVKESDARLIAQLGRLIDDLPADIREATATFAHIMRCHALTYLTKPTWRQILAASIIEGSANFGRTYLALDAVLIDLMRDMIGVYQDRKTLDRSVDAATLGSTLFGLQNARFFQFIADDDLCDDAVDAIFRADLDAIFAARLALPKTRPAPAGRRAVGKQSTRKTR